MLHHRIFQQIKKILPPISSTELIALRSGTVSIDRDLFRGKVDLPPHTSRERRLPPHMIDNLLKSPMDDTIYPNTNSNELIHTLGSQGFFSFIIDEEYGGIPLSTEELSSALTKITSHHPALGVTVMVPNSLGPGELLQHYGTEEQKNRYLKGLADGTYIPCFGLTGPHNGSDALGQIDKGVVVEREGKLQIDITINKRYITLAPVSNLIGLAFQLEDPNNLLGKEGITLALLERGHPGLKQASYHNPLNTGFPNGTLKGSFSLDISQVIGGEDGIGNGWKMLMECLAAGRGICLPATANASSKTACYGVYHYIQHRQQFNIPLIKMEGVSKKFLNMMYHTWLIQSSIGLTNQLLDNGEKPAVLSAVMKAQTTERGRVVLNEAMDIHAGASICIGYSNFLEKFYRSAPIGITVEGSNTLTRNLIIFGQGLNKSHPYIGDILTSIMEDDRERFAKLFNQMVYHSVSLFGKSLYASIFKDRLEMQTIYFAYLSNIVAIKGGAIKKEQQLSGDMADILGNLYLAYSVKWYEMSHLVSPAWTEYCISRILDENQMAMNRVVDNMGILGIPLQHLKRYPNSRSYFELDDMIREIEINPNIMDHIRQDIWIEDNYLADLEMLSGFDKSSVEYTLLYNKIINVEEYPIVDSNPELE